MRPPQERDLVCLPTQGEEEWQRDKAMTEEEWTRVALEPPWQEIRRLASDPFEGMRAARRGKTTVMFSAGVHEGERWLHVSVAHPEKVPSYMDLAEVKRIFVGPDRKALQIFPAASEHINIHGRALHLWSCLEPEGDGLPNFGSEGTI